MYITHADVQRVLQFLHLPLVGSRGRQVIAIDDDENINAAIESQALVSTDQLGSLQSQSQASQLSQAVSRQGSSLSLFGDSDSQRTSSFAGTEGAIVIAHDSHSVVPANNPLCHARRLTLDQLAHVSEEDCKHLGFSRLAVVTATASKELSKQITKNRQLQSANKQLKRKLSTESGRFDKRVKTLAAQLEGRSSLELSTSGKTGKRLNARSVIALGLRRNFANLAASDFGMVILRDVSASTVTRSEIRTAAALVMEMKSFCISNIVDFLDDPAGVPRPCLLDQGSKNISLHESVSSNTLGWKLFITSLRSDATNSSIWKREKLHVLEAVVGVVNRSLQPQDVAFPDDMSWLTTKKCLWCPQTPKQLTVGTTILEPSGSKTGLSTGVLRIHHMRKYLLCIVTAVISSITGALLIETAAMNITTIHDS